MTHLYGEPASKEATPRHVLEAQIEQVNEREAQILLILEYAGDTYQTQELRGELNAVRALREENERLLASHVVDPEQAGRDKIAAESRAIEAAKSAAIHAEPSAEVQAERRRNMLARRKILLDQAEAEQRENLMAQIEREERSGDFRAVKILRLQMLNIRAQLEREAGPL
jgi:hypothetical protein